MFVALPVPVPGGGWAPAPPELPPTPTVTSVHMPVEPQTWPGLQSWVDEQVLTAGPPLMVTPFELSPPQPAKNPVTRANAPTCRRAPKFRVIVIPPTLRTARSGNVSSTRARTGPGVSWLRMHRIVVYRPVIRLAHELLASDLRSMHRFSQGRRTENARIGAEPSPNSSPE